MRLWNWSSPRWGLDLATQLDMISAEESVEKQAPLPDGIHAIIISIDTHSPQRPVLLGFIHLLGSKSLLSHLVPSRWRSLVDAASVFSSRCATIPSIQVPNVPKNVSNVDRSIGTKREEKITLFVLCP